MSSNEIEGDDGMIMMMVMMLLMMMRFLIQAALNLDPNLSSKKA